MHTQAVLSGVLFLARDNRRVLLVLHRLGLLARGHDRLSDRVWIQGATQLLMRLLGLERTLRVLQASQLSIKVRRLLSVERFRDRVLMAHVVGA